MATLTLTYVNLDARDPDLLARFYARLLGWPFNTKESGCVVADPQGGVGVSCQYEEHYTPPVWPGRSGHQQMQSHLEVRLDDLPGAVAHALDCGASVAEFQPQEDVRVCLDPDIPKLTWRDRL